MSSTTFYCVRLNKALHAVFIVKVKHLVFSIKLLLHNSKWKSITGIIITNTDWFVSASRFCLFISFILSFSSSSFFSSVSVCSMSQLWISSWIAATDAIYRFNVKNYILFVTHQQDLPNKSWLWREIQYTLEYNSLYSFCWSVSFFE